jgi:hypothetical protein
VEGEEPPVPITPRLVVFGALAVVLGVLAGLFMSTVTMLK